MRITWREGVTTLSAAAAVVLERAYFHSWTWPLVSSTRWVIVGLALLFAVSYAFSYLLDETAPAGWSWTANILGGVAIMLTGLGLLFPASDYVVLMMLANVAFWAAAVVDHLMVHTPMTQHPAT